MVSNCDNRKQLWASPEFIKILEKIKATLVIQGKTISIPKLTEELMKCPSFEKVLSELCDVEDKDKFEITLKVDKKKLWE